MNLLDRIRSNPLNPFSMYPSSKSVDRLPAASVSAVVDDSPGWSSLTGRTQDYDPSEIQEIYADALVAWRKNPIAFRIVSIITDYVVGDNIRIASPNRTLNKFIYTFWNHPQNRMDLRLPSMSDELARSGDLFIVLFTNPIDGMSYLRFITKDRIIKIVTAENDWENELEYHEQQNIGDPKIWKSPRHPSLSANEPVMLHYSVNRPIGAILGETDLVTMLPWLQRYSRMLEDRVRLHWAIRSFLWFVQVPANLVRQKQEQYRTPPEAGSIVVTDNSEIWDVKTPSLNAGDAKFDMAAVRNMIDAGSGFPPHWRGEAGDANLATAQAMQGPTERHLLRRQQYFTFILQDLIYNAFQRARSLGFYRDLPTDDYDKLFTMILPEVSRWDNESLANAAQAISSALTTFTNSLGGKSDTFSKWSLKMISRFAGEPITDENIELILQEAKANPVVPNANPPPPSAHDPAPKNDDAGDKRP
jgi:hypothetical protein